MELFLGGCYQGKKEYVLKLHPECKGQVIEGENLPADWDGMIKELQEFENPVINHLHLWIRKCLEQQTDVELLADKLLETYPGLIFICDEDWKRNCTDGCSGTGLQGADRKTTDPDCRKGRKGRTHCMWNQPEIKINLLLIRHGKTPSNREHRYLGVTEEALSGEGRKQLEILAEKDILKKTWLLFISPMRCCQESAGILFPGKKAYPIEEWREMNFGAYEGKNYEDLKNNAYYQKWIDSNGTLPFPEARASRNI